MKLTEIIAEIEKIAPVTLAAPWDCSGMQVASRREEIAHLALMLDPAPALIEKALALGAEMILAHHPLSLKPRLPAVLDDFHAALQLLLTHDVPLYSAHTSLDVNLNGPAAWLADMFALQHRQPLENVDAPCGDAALLPADYPCACAPGYGLVGDLPEALPYHEFSARLARHLNKTTWRACGPKVRSVSRAAYCPGSGESLIRAAARAGADVYITGDIKYHAALEAPIQVLDVGHFVLEEHMMHAFADRLREACAPLAVSFIASADPFTFTNA